MRMDILFITELAPFPPDRGERIRSYNLINSILEFADRLHLLSGSAPPGSDRYRKVTHHEFPEFYSKNRWMNLLLLFFRRRRFVKTLEALADSVHPDLVFLDYNFFGNYIRIFKKRGIRVLYGTHNVQSRLNYQKPAYNLRDLIHKKIRFVMERVHERIYFRDADVLIAVSEEDLVLYRNRLKHPNPYLIPNYIDEKEYTEELAAVKKDQVIMTGNFFAFQNHSGLRWFLEEVWDEELAGLANFIIAGHWSKEFVDQIKLGNACVENVRALGTVSNLKGYIAESRAAIIPLMHGSGTRLKCIEAMALKTNIVSTSLGVEGIRHDGAILTADNAADFKNKLISVLNDEVHNEEKAYQIFLDNYSYSSITPKLKSILLP